MTAISAQGLRKAYGDVQALDGLSLAVERGELYGFLGPNGAGKTTTIEILTGQLHPDAGQATVLGLDPTREPVATREQAGIVPEQLSPPSFLTPREYFEFVGRVRDLAEETVHERVAEWAQRLGFRGKLDTMCADLSRGQQQKVMVTQAFVHEPEAVFIDEPLANLDPIVQERVKRSLVAYAEKDNAMLVSTHNVEVAEDICTRVGIVANGRLVAEREAHAFDDKPLLDVFLEEVEEADARDTPTLEGG